MPICVTSSKFGRFTSHINSLLASISSYEDMTSLEYSLIKTARVINPDVILFLTHTAGHSALQQLHKIKSNPKLIAWWGDPPANLKKLELLDSGWDSIFIKDKLTAAKLRGAGLNSFHLAEAFNPKWHKPIGVAGRENSFCIAGNSYGYRQFFCSSLAAQGVPVKVFGSKPPTWSIPSYKKLHVNTYIAKEKKSQIFYESVACLNHSALSEADSMNCRAFEICGVGGLQVIEHKPCLEDYFQPGKEVLEFNSIDEIVEIYKKLTKFPNEYDSVRALGRKRALDNYTYQHRLNELLRIAFKDS